MGLSSPVVYNILAIAFKYQFFFDNKKNMYLSNKKRIKAKEFLGPEIKRSKRSRETFTQINSGGSQLQILTHMYDVMS